MVHETSSFAVQFFFSFLASASPLSFANSKQFLLSFSNSILFFLAGHISFKFLQFGSHCLAFVATVTATK